ncbi:hypothetical protein GBAR_LOCUS1897 [Geodia barretti]|uniref:Uncharacterized protein n=1 Tax=Geodia barretti TaxID=519541 RepID=A0AA35QXW2_GEOBA|nr:hypothetical protein GBAR_LOCUS1897 [Geodia barretti]
MQVELCRESCSLINLVHCRNKCVNETYDTPDSSACQVCRKDACDTGCEVKQELQAIDEEGTDPNALPPAPNGRLELTIADASDDVSPHTSDAGLYTMDPSGAVPQESNSSAVIRHPTVIILRVSGRKHKYVWLTSFEEILNLTAYACEEVRIQLGAINKFGLAPTSYSPHTSLSVEVYGESLPTCAAHPKNVNFIKEKVNMTGYWKHANVIVHWKRREKGFELLDHYEARFQLEKPDEQPYCRPTNLTKRVERSITGDDLRWNISAGAVGDGPVSDCHYTVTIEAVSLDRSICPTYPPDVHKVHISSLDTTPVPLDLQWGQEWDDKTGNFTYNLDWSMPDDTNVQRAVGSFEVLVDLIAPDNTYETLSSTVYFTNASSGLAYHHTQRVKYDEKNFKHQITLKSHPGDLSLAVLIPSQRKQTFSAEALPPAQVVGVTAELITPIAESKTSTVTLDIAVAWGEVEAEVAYYQLRVARDNTTGPLQYMKFNQLNLQLPLVDSEWHWATADHVSTYR